MLYNYGTKSLKSSQVILVIQDELNELKLYCRNDFRDKNGIDLKFTFEELNTFCDQLKEIMNEYVDK